MEGFVYFHRKINDWEWYTDTNTFKVFFHLILMANFKDKKWRGIDIKRGQFLTSRSKLSEQTGLSEQQVRTALKKLEIEEITIKATKLNTMITINHYDTYQHKESDDNQQTNQVATKRQPSSNQVATTTNKDYTVKNEKKEKKLLLTSEEANEIYSHYPRKEGKKDGIKKLMKLKSSEATKELIIEKVKQYARSVEGKDKTYIKIFSTWCNAESWQDDYITESKQEGIKYAKQQRQVTLEEQAENDKILQETLKKLKQGK